MFKSKVNYKILPKNFPLKRKLEDDTQVFIEEPDSLFDIVNIVDVPFNKLTSNLYKKFIEYADLQLLGKFLHYLCNNQDDNNFALFLEECAFYGYPGRTQILKMPINGKIPLEILIENNDIPKINILLRWFQYCFVDNNDSDPLLMAYNKLNIITFNDPDIKNVYDYYDNIDNNNSYYVIFNMLIKTLNLILKFDKEGTKIGHSSLLLYVLSRVLCKAINDDNYYVIYLLTKHSNLEFINKSRIIAYTACRKGNITTILLLNDCGYDFTYKYDKPFLIYFCSNKNVEALKLVLSFFNEKGKSVFIDQNNQLTGIIFLYIKGGSDDMFRALMMMPDAGKYINHRNSERETPLLAMMSNIEACEKVKILLEFNNINLFATNSKKLSALEIAYNSNNMFYVELLLKYIDNKLDKNTNEDEYFKYLYLKKHYHNFLKVHPSRGITIKINDNALENSFIHIKEVLFPIIKMYKTEGKMPIIRMVLNNISEGTGVFRQYINNCCHHYKNSNMFSKLDNGKLYLPHRESINEIDIVNMVNLGKFFGFLTLFNTIDLPLSFAFVKYIYDPNSLKLENVKPELALEYNKLLLNLDIIEDLDLTFTVRTTILDNNKYLDKEFELVENGKNIYVTKDNFKTYVEKVTEFYLFAGHKKELLGFFKQGVDIILEGSYAVFRSQELYKMVVNEKNLPDVNTWNKYIKYSYKGININLNNIHKKRKQTLSYFWKYVEQLPYETLEKIMEFITSSKIHNDCFSKILFYIEFSDAIDILPTTRTCFKTLLLPLYSSHEKLEYYFNIALDNMDGKFQFV
ncbi:ubiquitin-transferase [Hokovirus HKV1]|uniref:HECT-type E3 ubiquitin transferase n=1 Tax=Hokovirus HKV1 TaxID=1977638 RepID=A0A1V0SEP0_9VIRU|nr:ubiquitin-transferase [Hokovirus HKV1]